MTAFLPRRTPSLPQRDTYWHGLLRRMKLRLEQPFYQYHYDHVSPLAVLKQLPVTDEFGLHWLKVCGERVICALENRARLEGDEDLVRIAFDKLDRVRKVFEGEILSIIEMKFHVSDFLTFEHRIGAKPTPAKTLKEYGELFKSFGIPPISKDFAEDHTFASMRVSGPNPVMLKRMKSFDERMPITNELFREALPDDSLDAALAEGRMYLADYAVLDGAELGNFPNGNKYLYAPLALFVITRHTKELVPVAIQCQQKPAKDNPIFTPQDGYNWLIAKTIVETADGNVHEASTHLGRTHLLMEPFVIASYRQLADCHPLSLLLWPHFEGTLAINKAAWHHLIAVKGGVDKLMGGTIATSRKICVEGAQSVRIMNDLPPLTFAQRGVDDHEAFPNYAYRDDAMLYWNAIRKWVESYLRLYYLTDADIRDDHELQNWVRELASTRGGRVNGLPNSGSLLRVEELIDVATFVIYTCSVQHAAVNFPQYDCMSYVPNMPLAGYRPAPTTRKGATEEDLIAMLPPVDMAELQMELGYILGTVRYTQLGHYPNGHFVDGRVSPLLQVFQNSLEAIGKTIAERNQTRRPYETLAPVGIPQSINI